MAHGATSHFVLYMEEELEDHKAAAAVARTYGDYWELETILETELIHLRKAITEYRRAARRERAAGERWRRRCELKGWDGADFAVRYDRWADEYTAECDALAKIRDEIHAGLKELNRQDQAIIDASALYQRIKSSTVGAS